ncbi:MAG: hypothetical protein WBV61_01605 [Rhodanobacteraceae bacterium]
MKSNADDRLLRLQPAFARFVLLIALTFAADASAAIPASERAVLDAIYNETGGPNWTHNRARVARRAASVPAGPASPAMAPACTSHC